MKRTKAIEQSGYMISEENALLRNEAEQVSKSKELNAKIKIQWKYMEKLSSQFKKKADEFLRLQDSSFE